MRHGRRWASCAAGVLLVGLAMLWGSGGKESHAQPGVLDAGEKKAEALPPPPSPPGDLAFPAGKEPAPAVPAAPEDPEQAAEAFVDQTRQQADTQIKALTAEAEQLRARLKKVETALLRWQGLRAALEAKPGPDIAPTRLDPAPSAVLPPPGDAKAGPEPVISTPK